jgi:hypothetical protein
VRGKKLGIWRWRIVQYYGELVAHSLPERVVERVRAVRTDLDCFLPQEAELLA